MMKTLLAAAMLAGSLVSVALPASAGVIIVREAPPQLRVERTPDARRGYLWAPGHWEWKHQRHVWVRGVWLRDRAGYVYQQPAWNEHDGRWQLTRGQWRRGQRDRDGDGVPNRDDRRPNNPNRS